MSAIKLNEHVYSVGVLNPSLRVFDIVMEARYGTSYNAFLITGEKNVLVETVHADYFDEYFENICSVIDPAGIDALIMNHTEPDHSGSVAKLLEKCPHLTVYCTTAAKKYLTAIANSEFECCVVKNGDKLSIGGSELEFFVAPLLHWPDSMFTWMPQEKTLFTCDFLGAHFCEPTMMDVNMHDRKAYQGEFAYYYACIFGPFKPYVLAGLDKIKDLPVELVCTSHGPCLTESFKECMRLYREWSTPAPREKKLIAVFYASAYGCTERLAQAAAQELEKIGGYDVRLVDVVHTPLGQSASIVNEADGLLVGSCTINRDAPKIIWDLLASVDAINTKKPAAAFGSYGWSGEAVPMIQSRLEQLKFRVIGEAAKANFTPDQNDMDAICSLARQVASEMK